MVHFLAGLSLSLDSLMFWAPCVSTMPTPSRLFQFRLEESVAYDVQTHCKLAEALRANNDTLEAHM